MVTRRPIGFRRSRAVVPLVAWTLLVWASRIRNVLGDEDLDGFGTTWRLGAAVLFLLLAAATGSWLVGGGPGPQVFVALMLWSAVWWLVRGTGILIDPDFSAGFKAVHSALMAGTLLLVGVAWWGSARSGATGPAT